MSVLNRLRPLLLAAIAVGGPAALAAETAPAAGKPASPAASFDVQDRLFLSFMEDAALVRSQWWEAQIQYSDSSSGTPVDSLVLRGVVAFRPIQTLEVGGNFGFGSTDASSPGQPDGSGATDLQAYAKWVFVDATPNTDFTAGMIFGIPTGDDYVGLGFNSFSAEAFGGVRYRLGKSVILGGHVGITLNGDGEFQTHELQGQTSFELAFSAVFPLANQVSLVAEVQSQSARFDKTNPSPYTSIGTDSATQVLGGVNWRAFDRSMFRGAVAFGLTDGAPDFSALVSYVYTF
jgi:hypothetical protein